MSKFFKIATKAVSAAVSAGTKVFVESSRHDDDDDRLHEYQQRSSLPLERQEPSLKHLAQTTESERTPLGDGTTVQTVSAGKNDSSVGENREESKTSRKKTPEEIRCGIPERKTRMPADMKTGFWQTKEECVLYFKQYAANKTLGGGIFSLVKRHGDRTPTKTRGLQFSLYCDRRGHPGDEGTGERSSLSKRCGCCYQVHFEDSTEGFLVTRGTFHHSGHELEQSRSSALANPNLREIPPDLIGLCDDLKIAGHNAAMINMSLIRVAKRKGIEVTWTYDDIYNRIRCSPEEKALDSSGMFQYLTERGEPFDIKANECGFIEATFFVMKEGLKLWSQNLSSPIFFDTTFGTNTYNQKLGCMCTVSPQGDTVILASAIIAFESVEAFEWIFRCWKRFFKVEPKIVFTDGDTCMASALSKVFHNSKHRLCAWHVYNNVKDQLRLSFKENDKWEAFVRAWWRVVQTTDIQTKATFKHDWAALVDILKEHSCSDKKVKWFETLGEEKGQKFAYRFGWDYFSAGAQSTQRSEAIHSALSNFFRKTSKMTELVVSLDEYVENKCKQKDIKSPREELKKRTQMMMNSMSPQIKEVAQDITNYALRLLVCQNMQTDNYVSTAVSSTGIRSSQGRKIKSKYMRASSLPSVPGKHVHTVTRYLKPNAAAIADPDGRFNRDYCMDQDGAIVHVASEVACTCNYHTMMGLPCRHMLHVQAKVNIKSFDKLPLTPRIISDFWLERKKAQTDAHYFNFLNIPTPKEFGSSKANPLTDAERYSLLVSQFRAKCVEVASKNQHLTNFALEAVDELSKRLVKKASAKPGKKAKAEDNVVAELHSNADKYAGFIDLKKRKSGKQQSKRKKSRLETTGGTKKKGKTRK